MDNQNFQLYVHVPFCVKKCKYCDFVSAPADGDFIARYFDALYKEISAYSEKLKGRKLTTVFIGGGTPSMVEPAYITALMDKVRAAFDCDIKECTIECNPDSLTAVKLAAYRDAGINRVSIGMQTLNDNLLRYIGRIHDKNQAISAIKLAKMYFENVSADVMLGLPFQTVTDVYETLSEIIALDVTHISAYGLKLENGTLLNDLYNMGMFELNDDLAADMYEYAVKFMRENGFARYEISNFAKDGYESKHNLGYWQRVPYLGVGAAAYSFLDNSRFNNTKDVCAYIKSFVIVGGLPVENVENLTVDDCKEETIMLSLRTRYGLDIAAYDKQFGGDFVAEHSAALTKNAPFLNIENNILTIKENYYYISNSVLSELI